MSPAQNGPGGIERRSRARRLHSLSGVFPIGAFLVFHLSANFSAVRGADAYNETAARLHGLPLLALVEIFLVAVPLFFHGLYGLYLAATEPREPKPPGRRAAALLQRATGVVVFVFVLFHLWTTRLAQLRDHEDLDLFHLVQATVANPWIRGLYAAGILCAAFHFAWGLTTFATAWGLVRTPRGERRMAWAAAAMFAALALLGLGSLAAFRIPVPV